MNSQLKAPLTHQAFTSSLFWLNSYQQGSTAPTGRCNLLISCWKHSLRAVVPLQRKHCTLEGSRDVETESATAAITVPNVYQHLDFVLCPVLSVQKPQAMITGGSSPLFMDRSILISWIVLSFSRKKVHDHLAQVGEERLVAWDDAQCMSRFSVRLSEPRHLQGSDSEAVSDILLAVTGIFLKPKSICWIHCKLSPIQWTADPVPAPFWISMYQSTVLQVVRILCEMSSQNMSGKLHAYEPTQWKCPVGTA